jgi:cysteine desulfurase / selenocysteine lyase
MDDHRIRADFPILQRQVNGWPLIYLDNAATTHKPRQVLETLQTFYTWHNANIHRAAHTLGEEATDLYELAHRNVARFIGASSWQEIVFVRNCTEAINLVANALLRSTDDRWKLMPGDEIVLTVMEHHANLVPWQMVRDRRGVILRFADLGADGTLDPAQIAPMIGERTRLVGCTHISNVTGAVNPVREIGQLAHAAGALFLVDGAQSVPHMPVAVRELGCDFLAFSGHKMLAPMGTGALYARRELLEALPPFLYGGDMIADVTLDGATWNQLPWKYEAGTPDVAGCIALGGAVDRTSGRRFEGAVTYLSDLGMASVRAHELALTARLLDGLRSMPEVEVYGPRSAEHRAGVVAFNVSQQGTLCDAHLVAQLLNEDGIAVRAGGHCAYPLTRRLGVPGTVRASVYLYNTLEEIDSFLKALQDIIAHKLLSL